MDAGFEYWFTVWGFVVAMDVDVGFNGVFWEVVAEAIELGKPGFDDKDL